MGWGDIWYDRGTQRLRGGWRVLVFLSLALFLTLLNFSLLSFGAVAAGVRMAKDAQVLSLLWLLAILPAFPLAGAWALRHLDHLPPRTLGMSLSGPWLRHLALGFVAGIALISVPVLLWWAVGAGEIHLHPLQPRTAPALLLFSAGALVFAAAEELTFRGYLFQTLLRGMGAPATLLFTAACFAGMQSANPQVTPVALTNLFIAGVLFGLLYLRTGALWLPIGLHAGWYLGPWLFGLPVRGHVFPGASPLAVSLQGPSWLTGGHFGLEGGVVASLIILALIAMLAHTRRGLSLASRWWEWPTFLAPPALPSTWDFSIDGRYYQWKLLTRNPPES